MRIIIAYLFVVVQLPSRVWLFALPRTAACQVSVSLTISQSLPEFMFDELIKHIRVWVHVWWVHWWCCLAISSSDALFSFCLQSFPASGTFPMNHLFTSDNQNTGASASSSVLPVTIQDLSPLRLTGLISLLSKGISGVFSSTTVQSHQFFVFQLSQLYVATGKTMALTIWTFVGRVMSLLFNTLSRCVICC